MSRNVRTNRGGRSRVTGPVARRTNKGDVAVGRGVSNDFKHGGPVDPGSKKFLRVTTPVVSPGSGPVAKSFTANLNNPDEGATYKYTIDGSSPTGIGSQVLVNNQVNLILTGDPAVLNFKLYGEKLDYGDSNIVDINYTLQAVKDAEILPASGYVPDNQLITLVTDEGSSTRYTLDGSVPSSGSGYLYSSPFIINFSNATPIDVKAISTRVDYMDSQVSHATYNHSGELDYGGPYDGVRDVDGAIVSFSPEADRVPFPSKVFLSTQEDELAKDISFWGTAAYVESNLPSHKNGLIDFSAGENHVVGLTTGNLVVSWGDDSYGQTTISSLPTDGSIINVSAGDNHSLALDKNNTIYAWGDDSQNQISVPANLKAIRVAAGGEHSLALKADRTVVGWGNNDDGQRDFPLNLNDVVEISAGENHSAAIIGYGSKTCDRLDYVNGEWKIVKKITPIGKAVAWGINDLEQSTVPDDLAGTPDLIAISCGGNHTLALDASYNIHAWGDNGFGQCTLPALTEPNGDAAQILAVSAGFAHSLAMSKLGTVFAWGANQFGQTDITNLLKNVVLISAGNNYSLAYGFEPAEHIYYNTGSNDPSILYTGSLEINAETTIHAISRNKATNAASNKTSKTYKQTKLENVHSFGLVSSRCDMDPLQTGVLNPALFTKETPFAVKITDLDKSKNPTVNITISNPQSGITLSSEDLAVDDADCKRFSSLLITGDPSLAFDGDKTINNYLSFYPGGYVGYRFDASKRVTKIDFATNANDQHKLGAGLIQGSKDGVNWADISFFSNKFPKNYPPFLSLDGEPIDRVTSLQLDNTGVGYVSNPAVNFQSLTPEGGGAEAYALFPEFSLTGFRVDTPGMKYAIAPDIKVVPVASGANALEASGQASLTDDAIVHAVALSNAGAGYVSPPTVTLVGGLNQSNSDARAATAQAKLVPTTIGGINILSNTTPYESVPAITVDNTNAGGQDAAFLSWLSSVSAGGVLKNDYTYGEYGGGGELPKGLLIGTGDNYPPLGYHTYDGVAVPNEGDVPALSEISSQKTTLYRIDHFDVSNAGSNYTAPPTAILSEGIAEDIWPITPSERAFAVMMTIVMRGPDNEKLLPDPPSNANFWKGRQAPSLTASSAVSVARKKGDVGLFMDHTAAMRSEYPVGTSITIVANNLGSSYLVADFITDGTHGEGFKVRKTSDTTSAYEVSAVAGLDLTSVTAKKEDTAFSATAADDVWTGIGHGFVNGMALELTALTGGSGASTGTAYYVGDASSNTFKLYTNSSLSSLLNITTDVTDATFSISIWTKAGHNLSDNQSVILTAMSSGTGPTVGNQYFVKVLTANTFRLYSKKALTDVDLIEVTADISGATIQIGNIFNLNNYATATAFTDGNKLNFDSMDSGGGPVVGTTYYIKNAVGSGESQDGYARLYTDSGLTTLLEVSSAITNAVFRVPNKGRAQVVIATASTDLWALNSHGFTDGEPLKYEGQTSGTGPVIGTTYYVKSVSAHSFELYTDQALTTLLDITVNVAGAWLTAPAFSFREDHAIDEVIYKDSSYSLSDGTFAEKAATWDASKAGTNAYGLPKLFSFFDQGKESLPSNSNGGHDLHNFFREGHRLYWLRFHKNASLTQKIQVVGGGGEGMGGYIELKNHNELLGFNDTDSLADKLIAFNRTSTWGNSFATKYYDTQPTDVSYEELLMSTPRELGGQLPDDDATLIPYKLHITGLGDGYTSAPTITEEFDRMYPGAMYILESGGMQINTTGRLSQGLYGYTELTDMGGQDATWRPYEGVGFSGFAIESDYLNVLDSSQNSAGTSSSTTIDIESGIGTTTIGQNLKLVVPEVVSTGGMYENDMFSADSPARTIFETQLANLITFDSIFPKQSEIDVFLQEGIVDSVDMIDMGEGYLSVPTVDFAGGHGANVSNPVTAAATAAISKGIKSIDFVPYGNGLFTSGSGYLAFPEIEIVGGAGEGASATALAAPSHITGLVLTNPGSSYTQAPAVTFVGGNPLVDAEASCRLPVASSQATFTNEEFFNYYRIIGHGGELVNCQVNEVEFYSGNNRIYDYSNMNDHTLVIDSHGDLTSWGDNTHQQSTFSTGVTNAINVSAGEKHSLVLKSNGTVICFGDNAYGQANIPDHLNNITSVSAGANHSTALLAGGTIASWGRNHSGQCNTPEGLLSGQNNHYGAISTIAGNNHSLALLANGTISGWGASIPSTIPAGLTGVKEIAAGEHFSLALKTNGKVEGWGGGYGVEVPTNLENVVSIDACHDHALALKVDGTVSSWGKIHDGTSWVNLAVPSEINQPIPTNTNPAIRVYAGKNHGSILRKDGSMVVFGKICENEYHPTGLLPDSLQTSACCNAVGHVAFDLGQTYNTPLSTNEYLPYRSKDISSQLSADNIFSANTGESTARVEMVVSGPGYLSSEIVTGEYPLLKLSPKVNPETNTAFGPSITIPNWDQESLGSLNVLYTLDGTDPVDGAGTVYSSTLQPNDGEFVLVLPLGTPPNGYDDNTTVKIYASSDVYLNSDVLSYQKQQLSTPTVNITPSGNMLTVTLSIAQPTDESRIPAIYYTLSSTANDPNLATPTENDYIYTAPVNLSSTATSVKAKGFLVGYKPSEVGSGVHP